MEIKDNRTMRRDGAAATTGGTLSLYEMLKPVLQAYSDASNQLAEALANLVPRTKLTKRGGTAKGRAPAPSAKVFATDMAKVQTTYGTQLGPLPTDPALMIDQVTTAETIEPALAAGKKAQKSLEDIWATNLGDANESAGIIFRRAKVVAEIDEDVASAISNTRSQRSKVAKKGVKTRKAKKAQKPAAPPAKTETTPATTTTITTSLK